MKNVRIYRADGFDTFQYRASDCLSVQSRSG
jgi:hypothetical protein